MCFYLRAKLKMRYQIDSLFFRIVFQYLIIKKIFTDEMSETFFSKVFSKIYLNFPIFFFKYFFINFRNFSHNSSYFSAFAWSVNDKDELHSEYGYLTIQPGTNFASLTTVMNNGEIFWNFTKKIEISINYKLRGEGGGGNENHSK